MNITLVSLVLQVIFLMNFLFIIFTVFIERKKPVSALAWILVLIFLPAAGFVLYIIFGMGRQTKQPETGQENGILTLPGGIDENQADLIKLHHNLGKCLYTGDNSVTIYTKGQDKYDNLIKDIENAACTIDMLYFIFKNDNIGRRIVEALVKKAKEGITVKVIYDKRGSLMTPYKMFEELIKAGGRVCRIFPLKLGAYFKLNYMNHRKIVVVDGKVGYVGGMNIGDEYMGLFRNNIAWRDTHLRITGSAVNSLQEIFLDDWYKVTGERILKKSDNSAANGSIGIQIVSSGPDAGIEHIKLGFIKMIHSARSKLYIQTPYFIPDDAFLEALKIASASGADVRVMLPEIPDKRFVYNVTLSYLKDLLDFGIKVYLYPGFLHSKMILMDDSIVSIGTTNIDIRSFMLDFEINAFVYDKGFTQQCLDIFQQDAEISRVVSREWYASRGMAAKFRENFCRLFSPIL